MHRRCLSVRALSLVNHKGLYQKERKTRYFQCIPPPLPPLRGRGRYNKHTSEVQNSLNMGIAQGAKTPARLSLTAFFTHS